MAKKYLVQCDIKEGVWNTLLQDEVCMDFKHIAIELIESLRRNLTDEGFLTMYENPDYIKMTRNDKEKGVFLTARIRLEEVEK